MTVSWYCSRHLLPVGRSVYCDGFSWCECTRIRSKEATKITVAARAAEARVVVARCRWFPGIRVDSYVHRRYSRHRWHGGVAVYETTTTTTHRSDDGIHSPGVYTCVATRARVKSLRENVLLCACYSFARSLTPVRELPCGNIVAYGTCVRTSVCVCTCANLLHCVSVTLHAHGGSKWGSFIAVTSIHYLP